MQLVNFKKIFRKNEKYDYFFPFYKLQQVKREILTQNFLIKRIE